MTPSDRLVLKVLGIQDAIWAPIRQRDVSLRAGQNLFAARQAFPAAGVAWHPAGSTEIERQAERRLIEQMATAGLVAVGRTTLHVIHLSLPDATEQWARGLVGMPTLSESRLALSVLADLVAAGCWAAETTIVNGNRRQGYGSLGGDEGGLLAVVEAEYLPLLARGLVCSNSDAHGRVFYSPTAKGVKWAAGPIEVLDETGLPDADADALELYFAARDAKRDAMRNDPPADRNEVGPPLLPVGAGLLRGPNGVSDPPRRRRRKPKAATVAKAPAKPRPGKARRCPVCGRPTFKVTSTWKLRNGTTRRARKCSACGFAANSSEVPNGQ